MRTLKAFFSKLQNFRQTLQEKRAKREPNARVVKAVAFMNRYSILFHGILSCLLCFVIECISQTFVFLCMQLCRRTHTGLFLQCIHHLCFAVTCLPVQAQSTVPCTDQRFLAVSRHDQRMHSFQTCYTVWLHGLEMPFRSVRHAEH